MSPVIDQLHIMAKRYSNLNVFEQALNELRLLFFETFVLGNLVWQGLVVERFFVLNCVDDVVSEFLDEPLVDISESCLFLVRVDVHRVEVVSQSVGLAESEDLVSREVILASERVGLEGRDRVHF